MLYFVSFPISNAAELRVQALETAQLRIGNLRAEKKLLTEKVEALTAEVTALRGNKKTRTKAAANTITYTDELKNLGKKFAIMEEPWLKPTVFRVPLVINADTSPAARFADDEAYDQGTLTVLHEFVPVCHHADMINLSDFASEASAAFLSCKVAYIYHSLGFAVL